MNDWRSEALCKGKTARFFVAAFEPLAKATCAQCSVRVSCLTENLHVEHGVFGGLTAQERQRVVIKRRKARRVA